MRINKYLAKLGLASRRKIDFLIKKKKIYVNDGLATLGQSINPDRDTIEVKSAFFPTKNIDLKDQIITPEREYKERVYYLLYKPKGIVSSTVSYGGEECVLNLLPKEVTEKYRLFPVGRLDQDSEGLLILTNDGQFTYKYTQPNHNIDKVYHVLVHGKLTRENFIKLEKGVKIELKNNNEKTYFYQTKKSTINKIQSSQYISHENLTNNQNSLNLLEITLREGKNRQIRKMCQALGLKVLELVRVKMGKYQLGDLEPGNWRKFDIKRVS